MSAWVKGSKLSRVNFVKMILQSQHSPDKMFLLVSVHQWLLSTDEKRSDTE